jgi:hypothetical protein
VLPARWDGTPVQASDAHEEITEAIVKQLDVGQHAHARMLLTGASGYMQIERGQCTV